MGRSREEIHAFCCLAGISQASGLSVVRGKVH